LDEPLAVLSISYEQMRSLVVEALASTQRGQFNDLRTSVARVAVAHGHAPDPITNSGSHGRYRQHFLDGSDYDRVRSIIWDLIIEGVVRPGLNDGNNNDLPFFHVTDFGRQRLKDGPRSPYDPDGFLKRLRTDVPDLDPIIITYLNESLHTFRIGCLLSSTIALGCASEKALLLLIAGYTNALPNPMRDKFHKNTEGRMIKRQFDEFRKMVDSHLKAQLPLDLGDGLDVTLNAVFEMIRTQRNDAGHPTGKEVVREQAYASLVVFPVYVKKVYDLIDWLKTCKL
jgi:hypothetical protein